MNNIARSYGLDIVTVEELYKDFNKNMFTNGCDSFEKVSQTMKQLGIPIFKNITIEDLEKSLIKDFSDLNKYFIFKNRDDTYFEPYKTKKQCKSDLLNEEKLSGSYLKQTILSSNSQEFCKQNIDLLRNYHGKSNISEKNDTVNDSIVEFLNDKYHKINQLSYENTFNYLYNTIGQGIFVKIKNKILVSYVIFIKSNYIDLIDSEYSVDFKQYINNNKIMKKSNSKETVIRT